MENSNFYLDYIATNFLIAMRKATAEKIGVVVMFVLVLVVFSFAERDTQKIIQQQSRTAGRNQLQKDLTASEAINKPIPQFLIKK